MLNALQANCFFSLLFNRTFEMEATGAIPRKIPKPIGIINPFLFELLKMVKLDNLKIDGWARTGAKVYPIQSKINLLLYSVLYR